MLVRTSYPSLLRTAGFVDIEVVDLTSEYRATQQAWSRAADIREDELIALVGEEEYEEGRRDRRFTAESIEAGLLRRRLYVARGRSI